MHTIQASSSNARSTQKGNEVDWTRKNLLTMVIFIWTYVNHIKENKRHTPHCTMLKHCSNILCPTTTSYKNIIGVQSAMRECSNSTYVVRKLSLQQASIWSNDHLAYNLFILTRTGCLAKNTQQGKSDLCQECQTIRWFSNH